MNTSPSDVSFDLPQVPFGDGVFLNSLSASLHSMTRLSYPMIYSSMADASQNSARIPKCYVTRRAASDRGHSDRLDAISTSLTECPPSLTFLHSEQSNQNASDKQEGLPHKTRSSRTQVRLIHLLELD